MAPCVPKGLEADIATHMLRFALPPSPAGVGRRAGVSCLGCCRRSKLVPTSSEPFRQVDGRADISCVSVLSGHMDIQSEACGLARWVLAAPTMRTPQAMLPPQAMRPVGRRKPGCHIGWPRPARRQGRHIPSRRTAPGSGRRPLRRRSRCSRERRQTPCRRRMPCGRHTC